MLSGNLVGFALLLLAKWAVSLSQEYQGAIIDPSLILIPLAIGIVCAFFWVPLKLGSFEWVGYSLITTAIGVVGASRVLHEGTVCLVIVSPLLYFAVIAGVALGRIWFRKDRGKLNLCLSPLFAFLVLGEVFTRSDREGIVTDEIIIHAPAAKVWPHVTTFPEIAATPRYWLFHLGLPMPMSTSSAGDFVGAHRECVFSGGAIFKETVAEIDPGAKLTFDIVESPSDPELIGHLSAHRGQFILRENGDGTTTLTGSTWYTLHVRPLWYFDWWTKEIFSAVHLRVMEHVRSLSESPA